MFLGRGPSDGQITGDGALFLMKQAAAGAATLVLGLSVAAGASAATSTQTRTAAATVSAPAPTSAPTPRTSVSASDPAFQEFASQVETLGIDQYPGTFGAAILGQSGQLTVYALPSGISAIEAAVAQMNKSGYPLVYRPTIRSYQQLDTLTSTLVADESAFDSDGIQLLQTTPDPVAGTVDVEIAAPSGSVSSASSIAGAQMLITGLVGPGVTVESTYGTPAIAASRNADDSPFSGGSNITNNDESPTGFYFNCTSGFVVQGNRTKADFMLTAGHCGPGKYTIGNEVGGTDLGKTTKVYINDKNRDDFQTIGIDGTGQGLVWTGGEDGDSSAPLEGHLFPAVGTDVTQDGGKTGEVTNNEVISNDGAILNLTNPYNGEKYSVMHLIDTKNPKGHKACQGGDSGGPTIQRTDTEYVNAIGTIVAVYTTRGVASGSECASEAINEELAESDTSLVLAP